MSLTGNEKKKKYIYTKKMIIYKIMFVSTLLNGCETTHVSHLISYFIYTYSLILILFFI